MGYIVLPQAFLNMTPVLLTQMIMLFQDTSLVYVLSLTDFLGAANNVAQRDGRLVEMFIFAAVIYFLISYTPSRTVKRLERRIAIVRYRPELLMIELKNVSTWYRSFQVLTDCSPSLSNADVAVY